MDIYIQCVYGDKDIHFINNCIIPRMKSKYGKIIFIVTNYESNNYINNINTYNIKTINFETKEKNLGFAENHNAIFKKFNYQSEYFIIINPDCIPFDYSIDYLIAKKNQDNKIGIVEGRQWPFEHPKEYNEKTLETPWASGAFMLIDNKFYRHINGMDEIYFLYDEDVDLSWQAWLNNYKVIYEPHAQIIHFTNGRWYRDDIQYNEQFYSLRNYIVISNKFFGIEGEKKAIQDLRNYLNDYFFDRVIESYNTIKNKIDKKYQNKSHQYIKIYGINNFAKLRDI